MGEFRNLSDIDKVEKVIFKVGDLTIKNVVNLGIKDSNGNRRESISYRSYTSQKYNDRNKLSTISITTNDYIVFSWFNKNDGQSRSEEIYISYPHLENFINKMKELIKFVENNDCYIPMGNQLAINEEFMDFHVDVKNLASGKSMRFEPDTINYIDIDDNHQSEEAVALYFNNEEYFTVIPLYYFKTICYILEKMDLVSVSQLTMLTAMHLDLSVINTNVTRIIKKPKEEG